MSGPRARKSSELDGLVTSIYCQVWDQFHEANETYCQQLIDSLTARRLTQATDYQGSYRNEVHNNTTQDFQILSTPSDEHCTFDITVVDFVADGPTSRSSQITGERISFHSEVRPSDVYESYAPCPRNINIEDDSNKLSFIPYADEPHFPSEDYIGFFENFSWQTDLFNDPDVESIEIETAHRLHFEYGIHLEDIDATYILANRLRNVSNRSGLIHNAGQRDLFTWGRSALAEGFPLPRPPAPNASDVAGRLQSLASEFCPNLNCIEPYCLIHVNPVPLSSSADMAHSDFDLKEPTGKHCGDDCFMRSLTDSENGTIRWTKDESAEFDFIFSLIPNTSPCDLATICRKSCTEVYLRCQTLKESRPDNRSHNSVDVRKKHRFLIKVPQNTDDITLCDHEGLCDSIRCPCFKNESYCERNCGCSVSCQRRWRGCHCSRRDTPCSDDKCVCVLAKRECDPELCLRCDANYLDALRICTNCDIQRGEFKPLVISRSKWGFGVFLACSVRPHEFIAEYVGELIRATTYDGNRQHLTDYRGRNYLYGLNKDVCIDANFAGNQTRFINHSDTPNCYALVFIVNSEFRIGIFADVLI